MKSVEPEQGHKYGVYFYRVVTAEGVRAGRLTIMK
jgi:hypothetical protein